MKSSKLLIKLKVKWRFASYLSNEDKGKAWEYLTSSKPVIPEFPRPVAVTLFHLFTAQDCSNAHLFEIQPKETSACTLCNSG
ncbi:uncharacterized protein TNCV_2315481 [Trichonephila clavipes]|nr:uncharacterized protein TNCV_2315481 [Trichonephila clavipes]